MSALEFEAGINLCLNFPIEIEAIQRIYVGDAEIYIDGEMNKPTFIDMGF